MKFAVIGAGGVGGPFGSALARAGHDVTFVARGAHLEAMRSEGLRISGALGDFHLQPTQATDKPAEIGPVDCVLFTVKLWDVESAGEAIRPLMGERTAVIPLQNGIDSADRLIPILGRDHVMGGVALINAVIDGPGTIRQMGGFQQIIFGELAGSESDRGKAILSAFEDAGVDATFSTDIRRNLWEKFVFLVGMSSLTAAVRGPTGIVRAHEETRALLLEVMREVIAVAQAMGVEVSPDVADRRMAMIDQQSPDSMASMAVDLVRGNRIELPWLAGKVVELGREKGVPTPVCRVIYGLLKPYTDGAPLPK